MHAGTLRETRRRLGEAALAALICTITACGGVTAPGGRSPAAGSPPPSGSPPPAALPSYAPKPASLPALPAPGSPSPSASAPPSPSLARAATGSTGLSPDPEIFLGPATGGAFYITIDDGWYPDANVLALMQRTHLPVTAFLISQAAAEHLAYWRSFMAAGGEIEDHTISHPNLTRLSEAAAEAQWAGAATALSHWFGLAPLLGRPPYGDVDRMVLQAAGQAGLRDVVMWTATMSGGRLVTYDHRPLRAGEIVLLHWVPGLYSNLAQLLAIAAAAGLHAAPLAPALGA